MTAGSYSPGTKLRLMVARPRQDGGTDWYGVGDMRVSKHGRAVVNITTQLPAGEAKSVNSSKTNTDTSSGPLRTGDLRSSGAVAVTHLDPVTVFNLDVASACANVMMLTSLGGYRLVWLGWSRPFGLRVHYWDRTGVGLVELCLLTDMSVAAVAGAVARGRTLPEDPSHHCCPESQQSPYAGGTA
ncbi:hypothetical protein [Deinococcus soli (ex Cha et al. 2016)]|uniref:Uncharacterized protein n=2 Tax=Deinococcus soli (ex Cha et al. 2016) TaxID=1309411 RepID=A0ACC6KMM6_9DEIO|nr:hypothetical protein [Deinococcus soli (ex Cha et al. 2016)]MDR6220977.1 hypothetical protein [Deinococcus soli (ex Cha et al. 2016)]MDR6330970.1 hypothetical protein [Deinococcus soli (ex Cha et al. 2016)]MDR6753699.1 hypothetical protein [Deinococcus soli (ex Cha et al. 2016)]